MSLISPKHFSLLLLSTSLHPFYYSCPRIYSSHLCFSFSAFTLLWPSLMESHSFYNSPLLSPFLPLMPSSLLLTVLFSLLRYPEESSWLSPSTPGSFHQGPGPQWAQLVPNLYFGPPGRSCSLLRSHVLCHGCRRWRFWLSLTTGLPLLLQGAPGFSDPEAAVQGSTRETDDWGIEGPAGLPWF